MYICVYMYIYIIYMYVYIYIYIYIYIYLFINAYVYIYIYIYIYVYVYIYIYMLRGAPCSRAHPSAATTPPETAGRLAVSGSLLLLLLYSRTGPRRALSLKLSETRVYEPEKRTRLGRNRELCTLSRARHHCRPVYHTVTV